MYSFFTGILFYFFFKCQLIESHKKFQIHKRHNEPTNETKIWH